MTSDLGQFIQQTPLCDSHEHLNKEKAWVEDGPRDVLEDLFTNYQPADLLSAGASEEQVQRLCDGSDPDQQGRFEAVRSSWEAVRFTGYGEAVRILAQELYGLREWSQNEFTAAQEKLHGWRQPGGRYRLLKEVANIDHTQTDDFCWPCLPDDSGSDFFFYDISWAAFCDGRIDFEALQLETGVEVTNLSQLRQAMETIFDRHAAHAIAVKAQHAYNRTLYWEERDDASAATALEAVRAGKPSEATRLTLGDWCWARGVELAIEHDLPFKLHTGYYAGNDRMPVDRIKGGHLCALLNRYLDCRFVLMHIAYPYCDELLALTKHYHNVYADLCWAWSIDPYSSSDFLRRFIHTAPANKLFAFGGDTRWPTSATAYSIQTRRWLQYSLESEVTDGLLSEPEAIEVAGRLMRGNQYACFNVESKRAACATVGS